METCHFSLLAKLTLRNRLWLVSSELEETLAKEKRGSMASAVCLLLGKLGRGREGGRYTGPFLNLQQMPTCPAGCQNPRLGERRLQ